MSANRTIKATNSMIRAIETTKTTKMMSSLVISTVLNKCQSTKDHTRKSLKYSNLPDKEQSIPDSRNTQVSIMRTWQKSQWTSFLSFRKQK